MNDFVLAVDKAEDKIQRYRRRDYRSLCRKCGRWMRNKPTEKTPAKRRSPPHANMCVDCPLPERFDL